MGYILLQCIHSAKVNAFVPGTRWSSRKTGSESVCCVHSARTMPSAVTNRAVVAKVQPLNLHVMGSL